jgi:hypothetical protein
MVRCVPNCYKRSIHRNSFHYAAAQRDRRTYAAAHVAAAQRDRRTYAAAAHVAAAQRDRRTYAAAAHVAAAQRDRRIPHAPTLISRRCVAFPNAPRAIARAITPAWFY